MSYYFVANIKITNEEEYTKYLTQVDEIFEKYEGKYLAVDKTPLLLEGNWDYTRAIIIEFKTLDAFNQWYYSNDYQIILKHRLEGAFCDTILVKGLNAV